MAKEIMGSCPQGSGEKVFRDTIKLGVASLTRVMKQLVTNQVMMQVLTPKRTKYFTQLKEIVS